MHDITIRIFGLSGDTIAAYAVASTSCGTCMAEVGQGCKGMPANRTCRSRFKAGIDALDNAGANVVMAELARADRGE